MASPSRGVRYQGVEKESFAYKMMNRLGWEEGRGLGAKEQGITSHIRAKKKDDLTGVGRNEADKAKGDWTLNMSEYDRILTNLRTHHGEAEEPGATTPTTTTSSDGGDGKRKEKRRKEKKSKKKLVRAQGRYKKRESAKTVRNYSATDLAAILGTSAEDPSLALLRQGPAEKTADNAAAAGAKKRIVIELDAGDAERRLRDYKPTKLTSDWWGINQFTQSSRLLGDQEVAVVQKGDKPADNAFTEEDQENIYANAQKMGTQNRLGLGMSDRVKISGGNWKGKKMTFGGDDGDGEDDSDESSDDRVALTVAAAAASAGEREAEAATRGSVSKGALKALIAKVLEDRRRRKSKKRSEIKASKLKEEVFRRGGIEETAESVDRFFKALQSKKFTFDGKKVDLLKSAGGNKK